MLRSIFITPFVYQFRSLINKYSHFVFPKGCCPNISDPSTFETNYDSVIQIEIENILNLTLANDSTWEEVLYFYNNEKNITEWEDMLRFGISEA